MNFVFQYLVILFERKPSVGWVGSFLATSGGVYSFMEHTINVLTIITLLIGIITGGITLYLQIRTLREKNRSSRK
ncbi:MAG: hypothetical protein AAFX93_18525 [Verrucomicrobiota bacterium]